MGRVQNFNYRVNMKKQEKCYLSNIQEPEGYDWKHSFTVHSAKKERYTETSDVHILRKQFSHHPLQKANHLQPSPPKE